jgi:cytochrome P450
VFNPDRWDVLSGEAADMYAFQAFSQGPRICIGRQFGVMEFKTILIELVKRFRFERIGSGEVEVINPGVVLRPLGGLKVKVVRRE